MKALTIGGATVDIIASVADHNLERMTMHNATSNYLLLEEGKKIEAQSVDFYIGGGATNAAVSMARMGVDTACLAKIGDDAEGLKVQERLRQENVDTRPLLTHHEEVTGRAVMVASHAKNPTIFVARGANTTLLESDIREETFDGKDLVYITGLSGNSSDCFEKIVTLAKNAGAMVACNPGIRQLSSRGNTFFEVLPHIDFLTLNEVESAALIPVLSVRAEDVPDFVPTVKIAEEDLPRLFRSGLEINGFAMTLSSFFKALLNKGVKRFLMTDGKYGAYLVDETGLVFCPSQKANVKGTAGAGDSFASTCALQLAKGNSVENALKMAALNASSVVSRVDSQSGLQTEPTLLSLMEHADWSGLTHFSWAE